MGKALSANDAWIAACAVRHGIPLLTHNIRHFTHIPSLTVISEGKNA
jgi:predicted nucleic acid-binding protein